MSYLRPLNLQPDSLRQCALDAWLRHLLHLIRDNQIISRGKPLALSPSFHLLEDCLKVGERKQALSTPEQGEISPCTIALQWNLNFFSRCIIELKCII